MKQGSDDSRRRHHRLALLGLAADDAERPASCPGSEVLAELVDRGPATAGLREALDHLAGCEQCYGEWLVLHEERRRRHESDTPPRMLLARPRHLVWTGSALAIAASIFVFLAIPYEQSDRRSGPPAVSREALPGAGPAERSGSRQPRTRADDVQVPVRPAAKSEFQQEPDQAAAAPPAPASPPAEDGVRDRESETTGMEQKTAVRTRRLDAAEGDVTTDKEMMMEEFDTDAAPHTREFREQAPAPPEGGPGAGMAGSEPEAVIERIRAVCYAASVAPAEVDEVSSLLASALKEAAAAGERQRLLAEIDRILAGRQDYPDSPAVCRRLRQLGERWDISGRTGERPPEAFE